MSIEVTARHLRVTETIQAYARSKAGELMESFPRIEHVHVIIDQEKRDNVVEVIVQAKRRVRIEAKEASENLRASIDAAVLKVEKQLRKVTAKVQERRVKAAKKRPPADVAAVEGGIL